MPTQSCVRSITRSLNSRLTLIPVIELQQRGIRIGESVYRDKVLGCWLGKNAGGTLGGPIEFKFGREELFDVDWYPDLPEGGIPNDDLEMQLIWLQAIQERGPGITARDLVDYWLDCIRYNFDEYGLSKTNLQKGLGPPLSGWHNNAFRDCMGSPIRSEIWACLAPGTPEIAAMYAFQDAICDHGGGESVFGEIFNAVVESCAFVQSDRLLLIETGLSAIPVKSLTAQAIRLAATLFRDGVDWKTARNEVKKQFFRPLAQYSPINMGFQTIGLLYGEDFGDAICKTANCGWDTDSTAATVGAIFGLIYGAEKLPERWLAPLGYEISTNLRNGGIKYLRAPTDIKQLTDQITCLAPRILKFWNSDTVISPEAPHSVENPASLKLSSDWLNNYGGNRVTWDLSTIQASIAYNNHCAILGSEPATVQVEIFNPRPEAIRVCIGLDLPASWTVSPNCCSEKTVEPYGTYKTKYLVRAPQESIYDSNRGSVILTVEGRPALERLPLVFLGGSKWLHSPLFQNASIDFGTDWDRKLFEQPPAEWTELWRSGNNLEIEEEFDRHPGILYLLHFIQSEREEPVRLGVSNNGRMKLRLNGKYIHETQTRTALRANQGNGGGDGSNYVDTKLLQGWNEILIKLERHAEPIEAHFTIGKLDSKCQKCVGHAVLGLRRSQMIWEAGPQLQKR